MILQSPTVSAAQDADLRARLVKRISTFPRQVRIEQIKSRTKYYGVVIVVYTAFLGITHLLLWLLNLLGLGIPGYIADIAAWALFIWACFWRSMRSMNKTLHPPVAR